MKADVLQSAYTGGAIQDIARHMLPVGASWSLTDYIPNLAGAPLQKRGGWGKGSTLSPGGAAWVKSVSWTPFVSGPILVAITDNAHLWSYNGSTWTNQGGGSNTPNSRLCFFNDMLIIPGTTPQKFTGSGAPSTLSGAPSPGYFPVSYKSRLVFATEDLSGNWQLVFSAPVDPTTWDVDSFVYVADPVTGIAALSNMILIFSAGRSERIRGSTPPSSTSDGDFVLEPAFAEGCIDARSIVVYNDQVIWANGNGVHVSDGAAISNLIELGGLKQYWNNLMLQNFAGDWIFAGGIYQGRYFLSINDISGTYINTLVCDLATKTWSFFDNIPANMFAESFSSEPELYMALNNAPALGHLSSCFTPAEVNANDGDGTAVEPVIEFPFFRAGTGSSRWRDLFLGVDLDNGVAKTGKLQLSYTTTVDDASYVDVEDDTGADIVIGGTTGSPGYQRIRIPMNLAANGVGLRIIQIGASAKTGIFDLEAVVHDREGRY